MPLVTVTTNHQFYPPDDPTKMAMPSDDQYIVVKLVTDLPSQLLESKHSLNLEPDTPLEGIQVDIKRFHAHAANAPAIWIKLEFSEFGVSEDDQIRARDTVEELLTEFFAPWKVRMSWAVDLIYPGCGSHGCLAGDDGVVFYRW